MDLAIKAKRPIFSAILWRKIHKWVGLILGIQFVLWALSGAVMALLDSEKVGGHASPAPSPRIEQSQHLVSVARFGNVEQLSLRQIGDRPVYEVVSNGATKLFDARNGQQIIVGAQLAEAVARQAFHHDSAVKSASLLPKPNLESRAHSGPVWRIDFSDEENSSSYVSAETGKALVNRGDTWRLWDIAWMLHNMDYVNRTSFNHPLIIFVAFGTLWLAFTGFYLLFKSFRRREFNWILGRSR